jgi:ferrous iron transport protein A
MGDELSLTEMASGETGEIVEIQGGHAMIAKLETLGLRIGVQVEKIDQQFMKGPVLVKVGKSQVAVGFGIASRVIVRRRKGEEEKG